MKILVTGGAGFIGSAVIRHIINNTKDSVVNLDKLTYAGNLESLTSIDKNERYFFEKVDICNSKDVARVLEQHKPDSIMHLAAESHVDRSIEDSSEFIQTNVVGTVVLLEEARNYWNRMTEEKKKGFRFHHVSTDEVYGDLEYDHEYFTEETSYDPSSPYSASKASSDHLVRAWHRTYGLPVVITNCSNNYGPYHFPEKLIPHVILNALKGKKIPVYGDGCQVRDWLYVDDHARALCLVLKEGEVGQTFNIGGHNEKKNIEVVENICDLLEEMSSNLPNGISSYKELIEFVDDRPGHDVRYAIDASKLSNDLGWKPEETFVTGLRKTVRWYLDNEEWWSAVLDGSYQLKRLGLE